jgi:hypothetical protein
MYNYNWTKSLYGHDYTTKEPALLRAGYPIKAIMPATPWKVVIYRGNQTLVI